jgi:F-type H+-transporting ATPase subunit alpha
VALGKTSSEIAQAVGQFKNTKVITIATTDQDPAGLRYIAPFAGMAIAREVMEQGITGLVIFDNLSEWSRVHEQLYQDEVSLLDRRAVLSEMLDRAAQLSPDHGGGSAAAVCIVDEDDPNLVANLKGVVDIELYVSSDKKGDPKIDIRKSVNRLEHIRPKLLISIGQRLRRFLDDYYMLSEVIAKNPNIQPNADTTKILQRGERLLQLLHQPTGQLIPAVQQAMIFYACLEGYLDQIPVEEVAAWETQFLTFMKDHPQVSDKIINEGSINQYTEPVLKAAIDEFQQKETPAAAPETG